MTKVGQSCHITDKQELGKCAVLQHQGPGRYQRPSPLLRHCHLVWWQGMTEHGAVCSLPDIQRRLRGAAWAAHRVSPGGAHALDRGTVPACPAVQLQKRQG